MVWETNVRNYWEETETYYITDGVGHPQVVDEGWAMFGGIKNMPRTVGWSTFIRQIILSDDVNIIHRSKHFDWQEDGWARVGLERVRNGPSVGGSFAARWARMVLKRCSSERGEREKRFYGGVEDERRRTAF